MSSNYVTYTPDDVYDAFARTNETEPFEFAKEVAGDNADKDKLNYYAGWFAILQNEGVFASDGQLHGCSKASDYGVDLNDPDTLNQLIQSGRISLSNVTVTNDGRVSEEVVQNNKGIDETYEEIKNELNDIFNGLTYIASESEYNTIKEKLASMEERLYDSYCSTLDNNNGVADGTVLKDAEAKYDNGMAMIANHEKKLDMIYQTSQVWGDITPPEDDKNKTIDEIFEEIKNELNDIFNGLTSVSSESEYKDIQRKFAAMNERLFAAYNRVLDNNNGGVADITVIKDAGTKYDYGMAMIANAELKLENLYVNGDVESLKASQDIQKYYSLTLELLIKAENARDLTSDECSQLAEQLRECEAKMDQLLPLSLRRMNSTDSQSLQESHNEIKAKIQNTCSKLETLSEVISDVSEEEKYSAFDEVLETLKEELKEFNTLSFVSELDYKRLKMKLKNISNRATYAYIASTLETIYSSQPIVIEAKYNNFIETTYSHASNKLETVYKRSKRVGQFGQLLINNNEPVRPTRQWTFIR